MRTLDSLSHVLRRVERSWRFKRISLAQPIDEYARKRDEEAASVEQRIDLWFSVWLIVQLTLLPTLFWLGLRLRSRGIGLLQIGFEDAWLLPFLGVHWLLLLATGAGTLILALANRSLIRRRMFVLGLLPWAVMILESLISLYLML